MIDTLFNYVIVIWIIRLSIVALLWFGWGIYSLIHQLRIRK